MNRHHIFALVLRSVHGEGSPIQTGCHLEGFDELSCAHATGTLGNDASETHLPLQVDLALNKSLNESFWVNTNNI